MGFFENTYLRYFGIKDVDGPLTLENELVDLFLSSVEDPLPNFHGPADLKGGRGRDHPRYGRWVYALAAFYEPEVVVEVGTYAGGTAAGWARALKENGKGRLVCIDNDTYSSGTYPAVTKRNLEEVGLEESRFDLRCGDAQEIVPRIAQELRKKVDMYLVDGDHHYERALADMGNGLPMLKSGGILLVHDVDRTRKMVEATEDHPCPVYEAFEKIVDDNDFEWCILRFIRKHLGMVRIE
jgi:predicted O-methyltransferase YrrM